MAEDIVVQTGKQFETKAKLVRRMFTAAMEVKYVMDELLGRHTFWKSVRILAWMKRFIRNCRARLAKRKQQHGPITTTETEVNVELLIRTFTDTQVQTEQFKNDQKRLHPHAKK